MEEIRAHQFRLEIRIYIVKTKIIANMPPTRQKRSVQVENESILPLHAAKGYWGRRMTDYKLNYAKLYKPIVVIRIIIIRMIH